MKKILSTLEIETISLQLYVKTIYVFIIEVYRLDLTEFYL